MGYSSVAFSFCFVFNPQTNQHNLSITELFLHGLVVRVYVINPLHLEADHASAFEFPSKCRHVPNLHFAYLHMDQTDLSRAWRKAVTY